jgi:hypothetical protein
LAHRRQLLLLNPTQPNPNLKTLKPKIMNNQTQTSNPSKMMNQTAHKSQPIIRENVVDVTRDYDAFKFLKGNRPVDDKHVRKLVQSMQQEYLQRPIDVNENYEIIDGQHRYTAIKELNLPLFYVVRKGWTMKQVQVANSNTKGWTMQDIVDSQATLGNKEYIKIKEFRKKHGLTIHHSINLLNVNASGQMMKNGKFVVTNLQAAEIAVNLIKTVSKIVNFDCFRRPFVFTFRRLAENPNFNPEIFINKLKYQGDRFHPCIDVKSQIELIEEIYNYRNQNKVNLRINSK